MTERVARTHTNKSNRAKDGLERKAVYKSVLDNPFQLGWPSVPENVQNAVLASIISALDGVADMHHAARKESRKRKRAVDDDAKRVKLGDGKEPEPEHTAQAMDICPVTAVPETPNKSLSHFSFGINKVTKLLEQHAQHPGGTLPSSDQVSPNTSLPKLVAVCLADINPPGLVAHLPNLVAACNSARACTSRVWLVQLPKGAEESLAAAAGLRRVAAFAIDQSAPQFDAFRSLLESVPLITASWLNPSVGPERALIPTHIKQLKTSAPRDMRAAKEARAQGKAAAKRKKSKLPKPVIITA
ncbi:hypothetical protein PHLGIDRAFT_124059 [Phlebiopsis gigantea 11061_1 CR5-6]|uniref:Uncharacterized protein n=1 Tax=Phlebiopsis gigantea (strain 11061_1 CR5-6) TaxID=745531 RepID=A0A0C3SE87_PHLG1|nr:hypothetical protein PHLGIDRAFT_124059 [Phlebiopsis gigantea 11061_1 CR5-6]